MGYIVKQTVIDLSPNTGSEDSSFDAESCSHRDC